LTFEEALSIRLFDSPAEFRLFLFRRLQVGTQPLFLAGRELAVARRGSRVVGKGERAQMESGRGRRAMLCLIATPPQKCDQCR
jgi:hypothetical protein